MCADCGLEVRAYGVINRPGHDFATGGFVQLQEDLCDVFVGLLSQPIDILER